MPTGASTSHDARLRHPGLCRRSFAGNAGDDLRRYTRPVLNGVRTSTVRVRPETLSRVAELSEHQADGEAKRRRASALRLRFSQSATQTLLHHLPMCWWL